MDLIPRPDQVVSAAGNLAHMVFYGGVADLRPMPRTLIDDGVGREVYHYRPAADVRPTGDQAPDPVLLVMPLAAPSLCYDLRRGCSLVEHLVATGRPTYLVEYGQIAFKDRNLGMEHWVSEVVPAAIRSASEHSGGRPVHVVGWSLGGIFALLAAADDADLPIASLAVLGSPVDVSLVPLVAPFRPLLSLTDGRGLVTRAYQAFGGAPRPLVRWAFQLSAAQKLVTKPLAMAMNLDDTEWLAQIEAVDRFSDAMIAYPGRTFGQLYHRFVKRNALQRGEMELDGRTISFAAVTPPVLVFGGATDTIAPIPSVKAVMPLLAGSREARFEIVPGGHLGMLTGRAARGTTWVALDEWYAEWDGAAAPAPRRTTGAARAAAAKKAAARKAPAEKAPAKKAPARKAPAKKAPARKASARKVAAKSTASPQRPAKTTTAKTTTADATARTTPRRTPASRKRAAASRETIGSNPSRRYGSAGSRSLSG